MVPPSGMFQEIKNYLEINEHETTTIQSLWDITKIVLRGNCIMIQAYYRKWKKISNKQLNFVLKEIEKEEHTKAEVCRRKEITNIINVRSEINELVWRIHFDIWQN